jgi:hypothetical protein
VFFCREVADFEVPKSRTAILVRLASRDAVAEMRNILLGSILSFYLELGNVPALHASAVAVGKQAIAFLADSRGGKTAIAAAFVSAGDPLLTDDILPLLTNGGAIRAAHGYPQLRMWPSEVHHFLGPEPRLARVHPGSEKRRVPVGADGFGRFCAECPPLDRIFLPERRTADDEDDRTVITRLQESEALIELVRNSFVGPAMASLGLQPQRLATLGRITENVPMYRLVYPSGLRHLPRVRDSILAAL